MRVRLHSASKFETFSVNRYNGKTTHTNTTATPVWSCFNDLEFPTEVKCQVPTVVIWTRKSGLWVGARRLIVGKRIRILLINDNFVTFVQEKERFLINLEEIIRLFISKSAEPADHERSSIMVLSETSFQIFLLPWATYWAHIQLRTNQRKDTKTNLTLRSGRRWGNLAYPVTLSIKKNAECFDATCWRLLLFRGGGGMLPLEFHRNAGTHLKYLIPFNILTATSVSIGLSWRLLTVALATWAKAPSPITFSTFTCSVGISQQHGDEYREVYSLTGWAGCGQFACLASSMVDDGPRSFNAMYCWFLGGSAISSPIFGV